MRRKVQYFIVFSNFILQIAAFLLFNSSAEHLFFRFEHDLLTKVLAGFILLMPVVHVLIGNLLEKNEKYSGVYSYKVFPILFIILLFSSWVICIYINAALGPFFIEKQNWLLLMTGCIVMYLANYVTALKKDNQVFRKLGIKIKNEYVFKTTMKIALYGIGLEGYIIILCGALGFFYNRRNLSLLLVLMSIAAFIVSIVVAYFAYIKIIDKRKTAVREKKKSENKN